jgi:hypothetical protein
MQARVFLANGSYASTMHIVIVNELADTPVYLSEPQCPSPSRSVKKVRIVNFTSPGLLLSASQLFSAYPVGVEAT